MNDMTSGRNSAYDVGYVDLQRIALLTNPYAGKGRAGQAAEVARDRFADHGIDVLTIQGADPDGARELAGRMVNDPEIDALVVCGGDGLINLALQEQAESTTPLGIIPAGTGNDHAREYGIPTHPRRAADVIARGFYTTTDLGLMRNDAGDTHWFGTIACAGFDSLVSDRTNRISWPKGQMRYNLAIVAEFFNFHSIPTRLVLDPGTAEERVIEENMTLVAMGNTKSYGGGMLICPDADHHDGVLDITVLERMNRGLAALKFTKIFDGSFVEEAGVRTYRAKKVRIEMTDLDGQHINGYADGDCFAPLPMTVELVPGAGRYIVPRP
ncbi:diacylglycerol kinase [Corynebacterium terpenotabidum]|uniref:Diacylglycerol kinase n=1 Tax=Corynebacterium terpenotabidum Y-11 TaxID=1200352 RepID=S4XML9_9CORY|nr:diacylglycerol kinase [Corynebacterium terpenotabidum]AGP31908.1 diacylglycerol kinase [Corynebacterium terpenotabidum Y-11]